MNCEQALALISARLDGELRPNDHDPLEAHLQECLACQAQAEGFALLDADLRGAFRPRRQAAAAVVERVIDALHALPAPRCEPEPSPAPPQLRALRRRLALVMGIAATLAGVALLLHALGHKRGIRPPTVIPQAQANKDGLDWLVPRSRPAAPAAEHVALGATLQTAAGQRRRVALPDGSTLYLNEMTTVQLDAPRQLALRAGEVFVEVAPRPAESDGATFVVRTPTRQVVALGTKFDVRAEERGTAVVVTQGKVQVSNPEEWLHAGQRLAADGVGVEPAPRASHLLDWTRDLMAAAESPLVPGSKYTGGALIAVDPSGQEARLSLRRYAVDVYIEDGFARTTIDQTYFNSEPWRLEGTFYFPLPPDASLSRLAMYVDGNLMEGGMTERDYGRQVYERIVSSQRDPALLEWVDGSTFKMRVFPLEGRQEKRIILSYTQRLPTLYGRMQYRFPAGHSLELVRDWSFHALVKDGAGLAAMSPSHPEMKPAKQGNDLVLDDKARHVKVDHDVVLYLDDAGAAQNGDRARFAAAEHEGARYLMLRYRPELPAAPQKQRRDWVFLFESSGDRDPLLARVQIDVIRTLLENAEHDDTFCLLTAGTRVHAFTEQALPATPENVAAAVRFLEQTHLVGAFDLGLALATAEPLLRAGNNSYLVHVGSGIAGMGERREDALVGRIPGGTRYVGVGVGRHWGRGFMKRAAEATGGYFTQINPDEPVSWRGFELLATLNTPRLLDIAVKDDAGRATFLLYAQSLAQGEELCAITRVDPGAKLPQSVTITGKLGGFPFQRELTVAEVAQHADYLPRTWAKLEIDRLLAEPGKDNKDRIVALSKAMYVMTPFTSLLVLENEQMYRDFNVDRGRKDHWALYPCPPKIPVAYEPDPTQPVDVRNAPQNKETKPARNQVLQSILVRVPPRLLYGPGNSATDGGQPVGSALQAFVGANTRSFGGGDRALASGQELPSDTFFLGFYTGSAGGRGSYGGSFGSAVVDDSSSMNVNGVFNINGLTSVNDWDLDAKNWQRGELGYDLPALGLVVKGASRIHARPSGQDRARLGRLGDFAGGIVSEWLYEPEQPLAGFFNNLIFDAFKRSTFADPTPADAPHIAAEVVAGGRSSADRKTLTNSTIFMESYDFGRFPSETHLPLPDDIWRPTRGYGPWLYQRASFSGDTRIFSDLVSYAPGMQTSAADIQAVLEAEAAPELRNTPGSIDPRARKLIERVRKQARASGWQALVIPEANGRPAYDFVFESDGRCASDRVLASGVRERVACDGTTFLHLYPELGIGSRHGVNRFQRAEINRLVPWMLPPAEDLAAGVDVRLLDAQTVALVPRGAAPFTPSPLAPSPLVGEGRGGGSVPSKISPSPKPSPIQGEGLKYTCIHLLFTPEGRLAERRLVEMSAGAGKVLLREVYEEGVVKWLDGDGKEIAARKCQVKRAAQPDLHPETAGLVVVPLPLRSREVVYQSLGLDPNLPLEAAENACYECLDPDSALALFTAEFAAQNAPVAQQIFRRCFLEQGVNLPGFYPLLAACGVDVSAEPGLLRLLAERPESKLVRYLACQGNLVYQMLQARLGIYASDRVGPEDSFLHRLAAFNDLSLRWQSGRPDLSFLPRRQAEQARALDFVRRNKSSSLGWAALSIIQDQAGNDRHFHEEITKAWKLFEDSPGLDYQARYEQARSLWSSGRRWEARKSFEELYARTLKVGVLPPIDAGFRTALQGDGRDEDRWGDLMRQTAATLVKDGHPPAVVSLARQCQQLGDRPLADNLVELALAGITESRDRLETTLAAVQFLRELGRYGRADGLVQGLLSDPGFNQHAWLWRLAAGVAEERGQADRSSVCLERVLEIDYKDLPDIIDLQSVRNDYGKLLAHYQSLAQAAAALRAPPPSDLLARVIRAADRWRALDRDSAGACQAAAGVLKSLGATDLAWEYLTTSIAEGDGSSGWQNLALGLCREGNLELADRAYAAACAAQPGNAQLLWDRAENLRQAGKAEEARQLLHRVADGRWDRAYRRIQSEARWQLGER